MPTFRVFYARPEHFRDTLMNPENVTRKSAPDTHVSVGVIDAKNHAEVFQMMQAENMTPQQVGATVTASGRTSMSVGDVLYRQDGTMFVCQSIGWITHDPEEPIYPPDELEFEVYYADPEAGDTYAKTPNTITFWNLGKSLRFTIALEASSPDDAYEQLQEASMSAETLMRLSKHMHRLTMQAGDALLQAGGILHVRTPDGWITSRIEDAPMR